MGRIWKARRLLREALTADKMVKRLPKFGVQEVVVFLSKSQVTVGFVLNEELSQVGRPLAFDLGQANFSGRRGSRTRGVIVATSAGPPAYPGR
jgi:hypothetical protein